MKKVEEELKVKQIEEQIRLTRIQVVSTLLMVIMLSISIISAITSINTLYNNSIYVDPSLKGILDNGGTATVYAICSVVPNVKYEKIWRTYNGYIVKIDDFSSSYLEKMPSGCRLYTYDDASGRAELIPFVKSVYTTTQKYIHPDLIHGFSRYTGNGVTVAIIDTGADYLHPDIRDRIYMLVSFRVRTGKGHPLVWIVGVNGSLYDAKMFDDYVMDSVGEYAWLDMNGHGTHVAGIIAGSGRLSGGLYRGMAPNARLIIIKAFSGSGYATIDDILDALEWVSKRKDIDIVNLSFGTTKHDGNDPVGVMAETVYMNGKIVVAAAGNAYNVPGSITSPAANRYVIAVGAYDPYTNTVAYFSSMGPVDINDKPDIVAVGVSVISDFPEYSVTLDPYRMNKYYASLSGTSMASAVASGIMARWVEAVGKNTVRSKMFLYMESDTLNPMIDKNWLSGYGILRSP